MFRRGRRLQSGRSGIRLPSSMRLMRRAAASETRLGKFSLDRPLRSALRKETWSCLRYRWPHSAFRAGLRRWREIYARAQQLGFGLAAAEIGPQLRLQYLDQPVGEFLIIGMAPIRTWNGEPVILTVANGGAGLILIGQDGSAEAQIPVASRFLFVRPDKPHLPRCPSKPQQSFVAEFPGYAQNVSGCHPRLVLMALTDAQARLQRPNG